MATLGIMNIANIMRDLVDVSTDRAYLAIFKIQRTVR